MPITVKLVISWTNAINIIDLIIQAKDQFQGPLFFRSFAIGAWGIWKERNSKIFRNIAPSRDSWKAS
jgi:hypothetical protein